MTSEFEDTRGRRRFLRNALLLGGGLLLTSAGVWRWASMSHRDSVLWVKAVSGPTHQLGHRLRKPDFPPPSRREQTDVLIIGGGVTGLSAMRRLQQRTTLKVTLLEMEKEAGGNSRSGENKVSAYPLGAHYLPIPETQNRDLVQLLVDLGVIEHEDEKGITYCEEYLCIDPEERLLIHGEWHEGLVPQHGVPPGDREQIRAFLDFVHGLKGATGSDGLPAFIFPLVGASRDPLFTQWDAITMQQFLHDRGWTSPYLTWYVDYCCRDDYGAGISTVSAWAGIHYFAARKGMARNAGENAVLTWPEGNHWLVKGLAKIVGSNVNTGCMAIAVRNAGDLTETDVYDAASNETFTIESKAVICALPQFVSGRIVQGRSFHPGFQYAPWVVANVTLSRLPGGLGVSLAWDNVRYGGRSLGYIVATHQRLDGFPGNETVITWYLPLDEKSPAEERTQALARTDVQWQEIVRDDLEKMHPEISRDIREIEVWVWGHGMITPVPGFITGQLRQEAMQPSGNIHFAHTDLSGISVFEEAFAQGIRAADEVAIKIKAG